MKLNNILKFLVWGLIIFVLCILVSVLISSAWVLPKYPTCSMLNFTENDCDEAWCNIINCNYNSTLEACVCSESASVNISISGKYYYNKTEIEKMLKDMNITINNTLKTSQGDVKLNASSIELILEAVNKVLENRTDELTESNRRLLTEEEIMDVIEDVVFRSNREENTNSSLTNTEILLIVVGLFVLVILGYFAKTYLEKKYTNPEQKALVREQVPQRKQILPRAKYVLGQEKILEDLKKIAKEEVEKEKEGEELNGDS
jgi:hypothetical protein